MDSMEDEGKESGREIYKEGKNVEREALAVSSLKSGLTSSQRGEGGGERVPRVDFFIFGFLGIDWYRSSLFF